MILYIFGADTFRSRQYLKKTLDQFRKQRDPRGYNTVILSGQKIEASRLFAEINSAPFLAEKKMVVVENIFSNNDKELLSELIGRLKNNKLSADNVIVFYQSEAISKVKEAKELQTLLAKEKYAQEFEILSGPPLSAWALKAIQARGGSIQPDALRYLCLNAAGDMWRLNSLIDQITAYCHCDPPAGGEEISLAVVQLFLDEKLDDSAFGMADAIVAGNHKQALKLLDAQRERGEEDGRLFGLILWQFRIILEIADLLASDPAATSDFIAKKLNIHPFVARKNFAVAKRYSLARLQQIYQQLLDVDVKTKTGQAPQDLLIDLFVAQV